MILLVKWFFLLISRLLLEFDYYQSSTINDENTVIEIDEQMSRAVVVLIYSCLLFSDWNRQAHAGFQNLLLLHGFFLTFWWYFEKELEVDSCLLFGDI